MGADASERDRTAALFDEAYDTLLRLGERVIQPDARQNLVDARALVAAAALCEQVGVFSMDGS